MFNNTILFWDVGKYYLADAGFPLLRNYITPFRSTSYDLNEIRGRIPCAPRELFNHRHSSLRNVIERTFGVWKRRFNIIRKEQMYSYEKQIDLVFACACVQNHVRGFMPFDIILDSIDKKLPTQQHDDDDPIGERLYRTEDGRQGKTIRDTVVTNMWNDWQSSGHHEITVYYFWDAQICIIMTS